MTDVNGGSSYPVPDYPGYNCCILYSEESYQGNSQTFCHSGGHGQVRENVHGLDTVKSYTCGTETDWSMIHDMSSSSPMQQGSFGSVSNPVMDFPMGVSFIMIGPYDYAGWPAANIFSEPGCTGYVNAVHGYNLTSSKSMKYYATNNGIQNQQVTSIMLPYGYYADIFESENYTGTYERVYGGLPDEEGRLICRELQNPGVYKSIIIAGHKQGKAKAGWQLVEAGTDLHFGFEILFDT